MFKQDLIKRSVAAAIVIAAAGFATTALPTAAQAMSNGSGGGSGQGTSSVTYTLPSNFHTDADSSGGYGNYPVIASSIQQARGTSSVAYALPSNFHTDADSGGGYGNYPVISSPAQQAGSRFQWDDVGIGAAGAAMLIGLGALGAGVTRRRATQRHVVG